MRAKPKIMSQSQVEMRHINRNRRTKDIFLESLKQIPVLLRKYVILLLLVWLSPCDLTAQTEKWDSLMNLAKTYHKQKEYLKSNECYQQVIDAIMPFDNDGSLTNKIKGTMALNYMYLGVPLFKQKNYPEAKSYFDKAIEYAEKDPKVLPTANTWMGDWYSAQALTIRISETNLQQSVEYSIMAEKYYELANAPEKRLSEQVSRATVLSEISQIDEAKQLLQKVISECEVNDKRNVILAKALNELGAIEQNAENYQSAIQLLERSYNISVVNSKTNAKIAANRLLRLYQSQIPDESKVEFWQKRINELKD